jgi:two-component system, chemotaxis family, protein-glutamate methylesterase/glutaminase
VIRILVVEDSKTVQQLLVSAFNADPGLEVVGTAETGEDAVEAARTLKPDLITMDINLGGMNGLDATRTIMSSAPVPIVIVSGKVDPEDSAALFRFIEAGALMVLAKPEPVGTPGHPASMARLIHYLKLMSEIKVVRRVFPRLAAVPEERIITLPEPRPRIKVVAIGASTGGPPLLQQILSSLPSRFGAAVLVVQHMVEGFTDNFVHWLNQASRLPVLVAKDGMMILPGTVYVAPHGREMEVAGGDTISLLDPAPRPGVRPSVSALFRSVALSYGRNAVGVLLSGMGSDGAAELKRMRDCGAVTIAQSRESCVVFGMPGEAVKLNAANYVLSPEEIIEFLRKAVPIS